jgi:hypothetical protein
MTRGDHIVTFSLGYPTRLCEQVDRASAITVFASYVSSDCVQSILRHDTWLKKLVSVVSEYRDECGFVVGGNWMV